MFLNRSTPPPLHHHVRGKASEAHHSHRWENKATTRRERWGIGGDSAFERGPRKDKPVLKERESQEPTA